MKRNLVIAVFFSLILISSCVKKEVNSPDQVLCVVNAIGGEVSLSKAGSNNPIPLAVGSKIHESDVIQTGKDSFAELIINGESVVKIKANSTVNMSVLLNKGTVNNVSLFLKEGKILSKPAEIKGESSFEINTDSVVVGVRGTEFIVETGSSTTLISVYSGKVTVKKELAIASLDKLKNINPNIAAKTENAINTTVELPENTELQIDNGDMKAAQKIAEDELTKLINDLEKNKSSTEKTNEIAADFDKNGLINITSKSGKLFSAAVPLNEKDKKIYAPEFQNMNEDMEKFKKSDESGSEISLLLLNESPGFENPEKMVIDNYVKKNPGTTLNVKMAGTREEFSRMLNEEIKSGNLSDVISLGASDIGTGIFDKHLLKDLKKTFDRKFFSSFSKNAIDVKRQPGGYMAILPRSMVYTGVLYVNKKLLNSYGLDVPATYEDLKKMKDVLPETIKPVIVAGNDATWTFQSCILSTMSGRILGDEFLEGIVSGKYDFMDPRWKNLLTNFKKYCTDIGLSYEYNYIDIPRLFMENKAAIMIDGSWRLNEINYDFYSKNNLAIITFPPMSVDKEKYPRLTSAIFDRGLAIRGNILSGSKKETLMLDFFKYFYSRENQEMISNRQNFISARTDVAFKNDPLVTEMAGFYKKNPNICYIIDGVLDSSISSVINENLKKLLDSTVSVDSATDEMNKSLMNWRKRK